MKSDNEKVKLTKEEKAAKKREAKIAKLEQEVVYSSPNAGRPFLEGEPLKIKKNKNIPIWVKALISLLPALIFLTFFTIYPILNTATIAFIENFGWQKNAGSFAISNFIKQLENSKDLSLLSPVKTPVFSFNNFVLVLQDSAFHNALLNTLILTVISVPLTIAIALLLAVALNSIKALRGMFQTIFFLPYVTNSIALGMVFNVMFSYEPGGIMNQFIGWFGAKPIAWIAHGIVVDNIVPTSKASLATAIIVSTVWNGLAFKILVFMSGLASIDKQYYDAAKIDGTSKVRTFWKITVPLLSPQILYITITSFIGAFKAYQSVISIVGQGPLHFGGSDGTMWITVVGYIYKYRETNLPVAAAGSVILLIIVLLITLVQMQVSKRRVHF
jgi:multiple sugar transport system permease protein